MGSYCIYSSVLGLFCSAHLLRSFIPLHASAVYSFYCWETSLPQWNLSILTSSPVYPHLVCPHFLVTVTCLCISALVTFLCGKYPGWNYLVIDYYFVLKFHELKKILMSFILLIVASYSSSLHASAFSLFFSYHISITSGFSSDLFF